MPTIDFEQELEDLKPIVWERIQKYLPTGEPKEHSVMMREYPQRQGKYFRPGVLLLSTRMFGGEIEDAIQTAAAMQTSEDWILIHDDVMDRSDERRSNEEEYKPTLHRIFGDGLAINAGDALHMLMWKMLGDDVQQLGKKFGYRLGWDVYNKMGEILLSTAEGQFLELSWIRDRKVDLSEEEYYRMINLKAGRYTVIGPLQLGAMIAGVTDENVFRGIEEWGLPFGCGFQIWDDVMNLTEESKDQGKELGGDILEGKRTLILIHLLQHCSAAEKGYITTIYSKDRAEKSKEEKEYILDLMERYGSIEYTRKEAKRCAEDAKRIFDRNTEGSKDPYARATIRDGIDFVVSRHR